MTDAATRAKAARIVKALRAGLPYLATNVGHPRHQRLNICGAVSMAWKESKIPIDTALECSAYIAGSLGESTYLEEWLQEVCKVPPNRITFKALQDYRHAWVAHMINYLEAL